MAINPADKVMLSVLETKSKELGDLLKQVLTHQVPMTAEEGGEFADLLSELNGKNFDLIRKLADGYQD